jgi:hypothetical protein
MASIIVVWRVEQYLNGLGVENVGVWAEKGVQGYNITKQRRGLSNLFYVYAQAGGFK